MRKTCCPGDLGSGYALGPGQLHIVLVALVHHIAPQPHGVVGDVAQGKGKDGQQPGGGPSGVEEHGGPGQTAAVKLNEQIVDRCGDRLDHHHEHSAQPVPDLPPGAGGAGHEDAQRQAQQQGDAQGAEADGQGQRHLAADDVQHADAHPVFVAHPQIPLKNALPEFGHLHGERIGESQLLKSHPDLGGAHLLKVLEVALHRHEPEQGKDDGDNDKQGQQRTEQPLSDIFRHRGTSFWVGAGSA